MSAHVGHHGTDVKKPMHLELSATTRLRGIWRIADPTITLASAAAMLLGTLWSAADGPLAWGWLALTVLGIFAIEAAKNASGRGVRLGLRCGRRRARERANAVQRWETCSRRRPADPE